MATLKEVAELAGVSRRTVDRVMNNRGIVKPETEKRIREALKELNYQPNLAGQTLAARKRKIKLAYASVKGGRAVIHNEIRQGAIRKAEELEQLGIAVEFYTFDRDHPQNAQELRQIIDNFDCDGLVVLPSGDELMRKLVDKAEQMEIPMVFYNVDDIRRKRLCYVGCDYTKSGQLAAGLVGLCSGARAKVVILTTDVAADTFEVPSFKHRMEGFERELGLHYPQVEIVGTYVFGKDILGQYEMFKTVVERHPNLDAVYLVNPGDYSVCRAIKKIMGEKMVKVITNDLTREAKTLLHEGIVSATISQDPEHQGSRSLQLLFEQLVYGKQPVEENYFTDLHIYIPQCFF